MFTTQAHIISLSFSFLYVASIYLSKSSRLSFAQPNNIKQQERTRNDPAVIRVRLAMVSLASLISCGAVYWVVSWGRGESKEAPARTALHETIVRLGFILNGTQGESLNIGELVKPYFVTPSLFLGPLYALYLFDSLPMQRNSAIWASLGNWQGVRNYLVAPITEEVVFRSCVIAIYGLAGASKKVIIFGSPLIFGLAHIHHAWETYNVRGRNTAALKVAVISSLFQFTYTTLFGFLCSFLLLRTGTVLVPLSAHVFCNSMGFPELSYHLGSFPDRKKVILTAYILGIVAFVGTLFSWTETGGSLYWAK